MSSMFLAESFVELVPIAAHSTCSEVLTFRFGFSPVLPMQSKMIPLITYEIPFS